MIKTKQRFAVHICNAIISLLCILSIAMYFIQPLFKLDIAYTLSGDTMADLVGDMMQSSSDSENDSSSDFDLEMEDIVIKMSVTLHTRDVLSTLSDTPAQGVQKIVDDNVNALVDQLMGEMDGIIESLLKSVSKTTVSSTIKDQVQSAMGEDTTTEEVEQVLQDAGITDEYINDQTDALIDAIYAENATVDSVTDTVVDIVDDVFTKLNQADSETFQETLSEETKQEIRDSVSEVLSSMADENGNLNVDDMFLKTLFGMLNGQTESPDGNTDDNNDNGTSAPIAGNDLGDNNADNGDASDDPSVTVISQAAKHTIENVVLMQDSVADDPIEDNSIDPDTSVSSDLSDSSIDDSSITDSTDDEQMTKEEMLAELKTKLSAKIRELLPEDIATQIAEVMKVVSYVLLFTFFTWAYLILKILVKLPKTNNAIKLKLPIWLGCIPFTILYALPTILFSLLKNPPAALVDLIGAESLAAMSGLDVAVSSGSCFSFIAAVALALLAVFYYGGLRRYLRKVEKGKIVLPAPTATATKTSVAEETAQTTTHDTNKTENDIGND